MEVYLLILFLLAPEFVKGESPMMEPQCPDNWIPYKNSCYEFIQRSGSVRPLTWEDARIYCRALDGDLVSIGDRSESEFINQQLRSLVSDVYWLGLKRTSSGGNAKGWAWSDETLLNFTKWAHDEPNNWRNNENCAEIFSNSGYWNDVNCMRPRLSMCERKKGLPFPALPTPPNITTTQSELKCDEGWKAFGKSCYKLSKVKASWQRAKSECWDLGGHLVKIDDKAEQDFLYGEIWNLWNSRFWIGLSDPKGDDNWQWIYDNSTLNYTNWFTDEPNGRGTEKCVEMYGGRLATFWNDNSCSFNAQYICEKQEGKNECPDDWSTFEDNCYQFNLAESQLKNWNAAKRACESIGDFSSLASISSQAEQDFLTKQVSSVAESSVWIGLNDRQSENVFKWSDNSKVGYQNWEDNNRGNRAWKDCTVLMGMKTDGAWTTERCSETRRYICKRKRGMFHCDEPLGMENGNILDSQITAKITAPSATGPLKSRLGSNGTWCPKDKNDYLQIDLGSTYKITKIVINGYATSFCVQYGNDGKTYKSYGREDSIVCEELSSKRLEKPHILPNLRPFVGRYVRITPKKGNNKCIQLELYGCLSENSVTGSSWSQIPSTKYTYQLNHLSLSWTAARSYCLEQNADLISMSSQIVADHMRTRLSTQRPYAWWIGLNDRDHSLKYYWTDSSPVNYVGWVGYVSSYGSLDCVQYRQFQSSWRSANCNERKPFICMKKEPSPGGSTGGIYGNVGNGATGVWMSSATHYWPLSNVDDGKVWGTTDGQAFGSINVISGVKNKSESALQFSKSGMYIDVSFEEDDCLTFPDTCPQKKLTLSFMATFDKTAANWPNVPLLDSLGGNAQNSTGISVTVSQKQLWFVVSYVDLFWKISVPIQGDDVWRHYALTCSQRLIQVFVNGKPVGSRAYRPTSRKRIYSKNLKRKFHIGLQSNSKVSSGAFGLAMLAFWEGAISEKDIRAIYKTEFGWCPNGWIAFGMSCYRFSTDTLTRTVARTRCQFLGGDLATISTPVEQAMITRQVKTLSWIGLQSTESRRSRRSSPINPPSLYPLRRRLGGWGSRRWTVTTNKLNFLWDNRSPVMYTNWKSSAFQYRSSSPCVSVQGLTGLWGLSSCYSFISSICEKEKDETKPASNITVVDVSKFTRVCQYSSTLLNCPTGSVIKIQHGFWGRKQRDVCRFVSIIDCGLDTVPTVTRKLRQQCDGSSSCKVEASNDPKHFGNPCLGVYKYLEVNYTCVHPEKIKESRCPPGWVRSKRDGIACYRLIQSMKTWSDAEKYCQRYDAKLLSISEKSEQVLATSLMERVWNTDVWIGLSFDNTTNTYKWSDESPVKWTNWALGNPRGRWSKDYCVYMNLERTTQDLMYWKVGKCTEEKLFICKKKLFSAPVPTKSTSTTKGSCRLGWTLFNNKCYRHYKNSVSWERARSNCRLYYASGNLAVITSPEVNDFLTKFANTTVWIGLEGRGVYRGHVWNDGTPVSYTNWDKGQPNSYHGREACTQLYGEVGYWGDVNCYDTKTYICERSPSAIFIPASVAPTFASSSRCKDDWTLFSDMCYLISDDKNSSTYKSWNEAELSCKELGGHLASVTSREEKDFLSTLTRSKLVYSFWIGLHDMDGESLYQWTDGTGYGKFVYWGNGEPNNYHGQEDCVAVLRRSGKWNDNHCSSKKPFICKSRTEDASKITVLKPATKVVKDGYCAPGWVANGQFCYEFHTDDTDYKSWIDAKNTCERGTNSSSVGELASIGNEIEQAFITLNLKGAKIPLWIGLNNFHYTSSYFWSDNSPSNYFNWNKGQPFVDWSRCVEISPFKRDAGKWSSNACSTKRGYICKTAAKDAPVVLATTIPPGITPKTTEPPSFKCSKEYFQYDESCYKFVNSHKTFDQARDACRKESAELISVETEFEQAVLVFLTERNLGSVWIGLSKEPYSALKFTDHSPAHYSYWGAGQPNRPLDQRTCIQANVTGYHVGRWDDVDCNTKNPFICEIYHGEEKITLEENSTCEAGWKKYKTNCFKYFARYKSWPSARYTCLNIGADLMSIADDLEQDFTMFYFSNKPRTWLWLGLHDRSYEGGYEWSDGSPLTYTNWKDNQPNDVGQSENCVRMDSRDGRWLDWRCEYAYSFVCKKPLECSSPISLSKDMITISNAIAANLSVQQAILDDNSLANEAWCPNTTTTPRIQIDLFDLVKITSITTKGRVAKFSSQFFQSFSVEFTTDGSTWQTYTQRGIKVNFFANTDGFTAVTKSLDPPIVASSIAVLPTVRKGVLSCMKLSLTGCDFVCQAPLGMRNGKILTNFIAASSANYLKNPPESARPNMAGWCAKTNDKQQWIQVDFGRTNLVTKIRTFGNTEDNSYVKSYKIQFSADGIIWVDYTQYGSVRTFGGNLHAGHPMTHYLSNAFQAQLVRIVPISWNNNICMRFELFGCVKDCDVPLIQKGDNEISEVKFASSDPKSNPKDAGMNSRKAWCTKGKGQYLEVDFGRRVQLKHIGTTGSPLNYGEPRRVVTFTLEFYRDNEWKKYIVDNSVRYIVSGNFNNSAELSKSSFSSGRRGNGIIAKKVRIYPKEFTPAGACMRVEFYGCLAAAEIIPTTPSRSQIKLNVSIRILNFNWNDDFNDQTSEEFKQTKAIITKSVTDVYEDNVDSQEGEALRDVKMNQLRKGSIIADLVLVFNPQFARNENISKPLVDAVKSGKIGNLIVDKNYIVIGKPESLHRGNSESKTMSTGTIAGIVVAVLFVLLLVVAIGIYLRRKRSNLYGPKQFNNPILYSTANTEEFYVE